MINGKNYYQILGVLDDAEDIVIRAAYKVLAQKYHPDKWSGSKEEATQRMSEINQAYGTLSDVNRRKSYDETLNRSEYTDTTESAQSDVDISSDWNAVLTYYPDLEELSKSLRRISTALEYTFKLILLEQKAFEQRALVAQDLEKKFLERYFGTNKDILKFAKLLILGGHKDAAKELNKAVSLLGSSVNPILIIDKIAVKYLPEYQHSSRLSAEFLKKYKNTSIPFERSEEFLSQLGAAINRTGFIFPKYHISYKNKHYKNVDSLDLGYIARRIAEANLKEN